MKARICKVCALSGVFCEQCEYKVKNSIVNPIEVSIAKYLYESEGKFKELQNVNLELVEEISENHLIVVLSSNEYLNPAFLNAISKLLSNKTMKNVKVVEKSDDYKRFINQLFYPAKVMSINEVWSPDGSHEYAIRLNASEMKKLGNIALNIERILSNLLSSNVRIILE
ncbi:MAG: hypothetical protein RQ952_06480 [Thermoproteota archaeon]|jgi:transcription antitermination factor NusA-like protein|nr:hypothetical protein [Thermoproteota archaeon]